MNGCQTNRASQPGLGHLMPILFHWLKSPVQNWKEDKEGSSSWDAKVYYIQTDEKCCSIYSLMNGGSSNVQARFSQPMSLSLSLSCSLSPSHTHSLSLLLSLTLSHSLAHTHTLSLSAANSTWIIYRQALRVENRHCKIGLGGTKRLRWIKKSGLAWALISSESIWSDDAQL